MKVFFYIQAILSANSNLSIEIPQRFVLSANYLFIMATETYLTYHRSNADLNNPDIKYLDDKHEILVYLLTNLFHLKRDSKSPFKMCMISRNILIDRMEPSDSLYNFINGQKIIFSIDINIMIFVYNSFLNTYFDKIKKLTIEFINKHIYLTGLQTGFLMTSGIRNLKEISRKLLDKNSFSPINYLEVLLLMILKNGDDNIKSQGRPLLVHIKEYKYFCLFRRTHINTMNYLNTDLSKSISKLNELDILNNETHQEILKLNYINYQTNDLIKRSIYLETTDVLSLITNIFDIKEQFPNMKEIENLVSQAMDGYFLALLLKVIDKNLNDVVVGIKNREIYFILNNFEHIKQKANLPPDTIINYFKDKFIEYENKRLGGEFEFFNDLDFEIDKFQDSSILNIDFKLNYVKSKLEESYCYNNEDSEEFNYIQDLYILYLKNKNEFLKNVNDILKCFDLNKYLLGKEFLNKMDCFYDLKIKLENMIFLINKKIDSSLTSKDRDDLLDFRTLIEHFYNLCEFISLSESNFDFLKNLTELFNVVHFLSNY